MVIYGVLLWADMNTATPLGARGRSVIGGARDSSTSHAGLACGAETSSPVVRTPTLSAIRSTTTNKGSPLN